MLPKISIILLFNLLMMSTW